MSSKTFMGSCFVTPFLCHFNGCVLCADGDLLWRSEITDLGASRDADNALQVTQHDCRTKSWLKYLGNRKPSDLRKNLSSLVPQNSGHTKHCVLAPQFLMNQIGACLHRFSWLAEYRMARASGRLIDAQSETSGIA